MLMEDELLPQDKELEYCCQQIGLEFNMIDMKLYDLSKDFDLELNHIS